MSWLSPRKRSSQRRCLLVLDYPRPRVGRGVKMNREWRSESGSGWPTLVAENFVVRVFQMFAGNVVSLGGKGRKRTERSVTAHESV